MIYFTPCAKVRSAFCWSIARVSRTICLPTKRRFFASSTRTGRSTSVNKKLFSELVESMTQMNEIVRGKRAPSRKFQVDAISIKELRAKIGLSQPKFAALLNVDVGTLRNWEQGRREPTGPAKALLTAISRDPTHVLKALAA